LATITFTVLGVPVAQPRPKVVTVRGRGMAISNPRKHPVVAFKEAVKLEAQQAYKGAPLEGPVALTVTFFMPRPKSMIWKTKPMESQWHIAKPDSDNLVKAVKDALSGLLWKDDSQVCGLIVHKLITCGGKKPRVEIGVQAMQPK
jgi:Holliday junction resolvase RusA-like endonuclease